MKPRCSVVIPTRDRGPSLRRALDAVLAQEGGVGFEIIVVDNGSTDGTDAVIAEYRRHAAHLRAVFEPEPGPSAARNAGVRVASADILAFTDDDVRVAPGWVAGIVRTLEDWPDVDCCGGRILPDWPSPPPAWITKDNWTGPLALQDYGDRAFRIHAGHALSLASASMGIRKSSLIAVGGFSNEFRYADDTEMLLRLWRSGRSCLYVPDIVAIAEIDPARMRKRYHRSWQRRNAQWAYRMRFDEIIDGAGRVLDRPPETPTLFGVPSSLYRQMGAAVARYLAAVLRREPGHIFHRELQLRELVFYMRACATDREWRNARPAGVHELKDFMVSLARRKWLKSSTK